MVANPEVVADVRYPWPISGSATLFTGHNDRILYFCKRDHKWVGAVAVFHRSSETRKTNQDFLRCISDVFADGMNIERSQPHDLNFPFDLLKFFIAGY
jgi:hypothetical protein